MFKSCEGIPRIIEFVLHYNMQNWILEDGESYAGMLYTWRSLSRAVPAVS